MQGMHPCHIRRCKQRWIAVVPVLDGKSSLLQACEQGNGRSCVLSHVQLPLSYLLALIHRILATETLMGLTHCLSQALTLPNTRGTRPQSTVNMGNALFVHTARRQVPNSNRERHSRDYFISLSTHDMTVAHTLVSTHYMTEADTFVSTHDMTQADALVSTHDMTQTDTLVSAHDMTQADTFVSIHDMTEKIDTFVFAHDMTHRCIRQS